MQPVQINRGENVVDGWFGNDELRVQVHLISRYFCIEFQLLSDGNKEFLEYLLRNHSGFLPAMLKNQFSSLQLFDRIRSIFRIDQYVRINEGAKQTCSGLD